MTKRFTEEERIKYKDLGDGLFESCNIYTSESTGARYKIRVHETENWFKVINLSNNAIVKRGEVCGKKYLRKKARLALLDLGVVLKRAIVYYEN